MMVYDLSISLNNETAAYPSDPAVSFIKKLNIEEAGYNVTALNIGTHTGTHADLPLHCIKDGEDAASMPLDRFFGKAIVISVPYEDGQPVSLNDADVIDVKNGDILIIRTGWESKAGKKEFFTNFPYFSVDTAKKLIELGVKAVGTDLPSVDGPGCNGEVHKLILSNKIIIIEALVNLLPLVGKRCFFSAVPLKIEKGDGSPVRAYAVM